MTEDDPFDASLRQWADEEERKRLETIARYNAMPTAEQRVVDLLITMERDLAKAQRKIVKLERQYRDAELGEQQIRERMREALAWQRQWENTHQDPFCCQCHKPRAADAWWLVGSVGCCSPHCYQRACESVFDRYKDHMKEYGLWQDSLQRLRNIRRYLREFRPNRRVVSKSPSRASKPGETSRT